MQTELFQDISPDEPPKRHWMASFPGRFVRLKVAYEDVVFASLGLVLLVLAGFCLGVERGKGLTIGGVMTPIAAVEPQREERRLPSEIVESPQPAERVVQVKAMPEPVAPQVVSSSNYVIQLASYLGPEIAQKEASRLGEHGIQANVVHQGKYFELRAVGFKDKHDAKASLTQLRQTYRDAFVKRVASNY